MGSEMCIRDRLYGPCDPGSGFDHHFSSTNWTRLVHVAFKWRELIRSHQAASYGGHEIFCQGSLLQVTLAFCSKYFKSGEIKLEIGMHVPLFINMFNPGTNVSCVDESFKMTCTNIS